MEREQKGEIERKRWQIAHQLTERFIEREDIYAIQLPDGRYVAVKKRFTPGMMYLHLQGQITVGAYLLNEHSQTRQMVLDVDEWEQFETLKYLAENLENQGIPAYLETSRRGGHLRLFFQPAIPGAKARGLGLKLMEDYQLSAEVYPKQGALGDGPGSLVRVPFGKHRLTGQRYGFIKPDGNSLGTWGEQVKRLAYPQVVPVEFVEANQYKLEAKLSQTPKTFVTRAGQGETVWERIKDSIGVYEFVSQYVELKPTGSGYIGKCPFHDDHHPSFGVNTEGNYWNCFAGCGGGSIIDFWMTYQGVDFKAAVTELEAMLLGSKPAKASDTDKGRLTSTDL